jgi:hypothetical protein
MSTVLAARTAAAAARKAEVTGDLDGDDGAAAEGAGTPSPTRPLRCAGRAAEDDSPLLASPRPSSSFASLAASGVGLDAYAFDPTSSTVGMEPSTVGLESSTFAAESSILGAPKDKDAYAAAAAINSPTVITTMSNPES